MVILDSATGVIRWGLVGAGSVCEVRLYEHPKRDRSQISDLPSKIESAQHTERTQYSEYSSQ